MMITNKKVLILVLFVVLLGGGGCTPDYAKRLSKIVLNKPEVVLKHCVETYNPKLTELTEIERVVYDTTYVDVDCSDSLNIGKKVTAKCPPNEVIREIKTIEIEDTRRVDIANAEIKTLLSKVERFKTLLIVAIISNLIFILALFVKK